MLMLKSMRTPLLTCRFAIARTRMRTFILVCLPARMYEYMYVCLHADSCACMYGYTCVHACVYNCADIRACKVAQVAQGAQAQEGSGEPREPPNPRKSPIGKSTGSPRELSTKNSKELPNWLRVSTRIARLWIDPAQFAHVVM